MGTFVSRQGMAQSRTSRVGSGCMHRADSMEDARVHVRAARRHLITAKLIEEGWVYDTPERSHLISLMLEDREMMMQVMHESVM
jgi:hypothetical protein